MSYDFYYWPIPFRGHPIRFILAFAGTEWDEHGFEEVAALKNLPVADKPYPFLAPPVLHDRDTDTWLSQMPAIADTQAIWTRAFGPSALLALSAGTVSNATPPVTICTATVMAGDEGRLHRRDCREPSDQHSALTRITTPPTVCTADNA